MFWWRYDVRFIGGACIYIVGFITIIALNWRQNPVSYKMFPELATPALESVLLAGVDYAKQHEGKFPPD